MKFGARIEVRLRPGIADPQGTTIERALPALGFATVQSMRAGKSFRFTVEADSEDHARAQADDLARRLLSNPVIEEHSVELWTETD